MQKLYHLNHPHSLSKPNILSTRNYPIDDIKPGLVLKNYIAHPKKKKRKIIRNAHNNLERVRATILIVKELHNEQQ